MIDSLRRHAGYWPLAVIFIGLPLLAVLFYGCESRPVVTDDTGGDTTEKCAALLDSGIDMIRPESLGLVDGIANLQSDSRQAAQTLSQWLRRADCRDATPTEPLSDQGKQLIERLLGSGGVEQATTEQFTVFEAAHLRDALLDFSAAEGISRNAEDDVDRVLRMFEYVTRTVTLQGEGAVELPQTVYESHLFGRGTAADRALLFASLLRQSRVDAVVIRPGGESSENSPWWIAVLLDDGNYLFDPTVGLPVPATDSPAAVAPRFLPRPATWEQAINNPELLVTYRQEAGLEAAPIPAESLKAPKVELIGPETFWKTAMERLELTLTEQRGVLLYDPLQDTKAGPGLFRRVVEAGEGSWTEDAVSIWPHTAAARQARTDLSSSDRQRLQDRIRPFLGPVEIPEDSLTGSGVNSNQLWLTRIEHMSGRPGSAIGSYQQVRLAGVALGGLSPNDQSLNRLAADEAYYWTAQAQFGEQLFSEAAITLAEYVGQGRDRSDEAAGLRVLSLAAAGKLKEAAEAVGELPETTPGLPRLRWLAAWWLKAAE